jgi:hypothetical protein
MKKIYPLETVEAVEINKLLAEEDQKLATADTLSAELKTLSWWNPRYWVVRRKLREVVSSFRLAAKNYRI